MNSLRLTAVRTTLLALLGASPIVWAQDVWDLTGNDDGLTTENQLTPGGVQVHDMEGAGGIADQDWFLLNQTPFSSYEVVVDGLTAGLSAVPVVVPGTELGCTWCAAAARWCPRTVLAPQGPRERCTSGTKPVRRSTMSTSA